MIIRSQVDEPAPGFAYLCCIDSLPTPLIHYVTTWTAAQIAETLVAAE
jgi:hypothetical protein